jgi:hypothetical protein
MKPIMKREFVQAVGSKAFLIGTILGPLLIFDGPRPHQSGAT